MLTYIPPYPIGPPPYPMPPEGVGEKRGYLNGKQIGLSKKFSKIFLGFL